jgi:3-isopropylmalate dehydrogenase
MGMKIVVLEGDGIGAEIVPVGRLCVQAANERFGLGLEFEDDVIGFAAIQRYGHACPEQVLDHIRAADGAIFGPHNNVDYPPEHQTYANPSGILRRGLGLYANMRPSKIRPGVPAHVKEMDIVIARENMEGFYADRNMFAGNGEFMANPDLAQSIRNISREASTNIAEAACEFAMQRRKRIAIIHKANVMKLTDGLWREACLEVTSKYPEIHVEEVILDAFAAHIVRRPQEFDVVVCSNMYGDIFSDLASELSGGLGVGGSINASKDECIAQCAHGSAPDIAGRNIANPTAMIVSCAMMLTWLAAKHGNNAFSEAANAVEAALSAQLAEARTRDLGGDMDCDAFGAAVAARIVA